MARFLNTNPDQVVLYTVPTVSRGIYGEQLLTQFDDPACAGAARLIVPGGTIAPPGVVGWLHPAVLDEQGDSPLFLIGSGQPVIVGPRYLYVPNGNPGDVVRDSTGPGRVNPLILWGFWRSRYYGPLSMKVESWA